MIKPGQCTEPKTTLNVQYRMHSNIAYLPSLLFYDGQIGNVVETERERNLVKTLMQEERNPKTYLKIFRNVGYPITWIDVEGTEKAEGVSFKNYQ